MGTPNISGINFESIGGEPLHRRAVFSVLICAFLGLFASAVPASASSAPAHTTITITRTANGELQKSTLKVNFKKNLSSAAASKIKAQLSRQLSAPSAAPSSLGPSGDSLYCDQAYDWVDSDGTFSFQHGCGSSTGNWGYQISAELCSQITSPVYETGMMWSHNGVIGPQGAPHNDGTYYCDYQFHGTFNPDMDGDQIDYIDEFTFTLTVDGIPASGVLDIDGAFTSTGTSGPIVTGPRG